MRRVLDGLYSLSGAIAALCLIVILALVLVQVAFNTIDRVLQLTTGNPIGLLIPSYAAFSGYFLVGATFFALASTLNAGVHIRVTLFLHRLPFGLRRAFEMLVTAAATAISGYFAWYAVNLTWQSWRFGDVATGLIPIPIWIPQTAMSAGAAILFVACLDSLLQHLAGREPPYLAAERAADIETGHAEEGR